jgi:hypothetical protein
MIRSKLSTKAILLATGIGLSAAAFAGSQPAAAQSYTCPDGLAYDPSYGCTLGGDDYAYDGYYFMATPTTAASIMVWATVWAAWAAWIAA